MDVVPKKTYEIVTILDEKRAQTNDIKKQKKRYRFSLRSFFILTGVVGAIIAWNYAQATLQVREQEREIKKVKARIAALKKENAELEKQKRMLNSDEYIEKIARQELGMIKDGEEVYVIVDKSKN